MRKREEHEQRQGRISWLSWVQLNGETLWEKAVEARRERVRHPACYLSKER